MNHINSKFTNSLINESSTYLLQHAHNPVNWHPWGDEALNKAKNENKLMIVSIGYAACHWCHVMEKECFEDEITAAFMNEHFICIKVDREERPDIDQVYMNVIQLLTGSGGWPLNCITLPDGRPIYGGTYFPKNQWIDLLSKVFNFVETNPQKAEEQASQITKGIQTDNIFQDNSPTAQFEMHDLNTIFENWKSDIDFKYGGSKNAPKFPLPIGYQFLMQYHFLSGNAEAQQAVDISLENMAYGGIYDQIAGGFSRYSVDGYWKVPHFEKMLYDNAQLISLYSLAYQKTKNELFKHVAQDTIRFVENELKAPEGCFYSSLDADSEGVEGKYYVWTYEELMSVLGDKMDVFAYYFTVQANGNWEHGQNILHITKSKQDCIAKFNLTEAEFDTIITWAKNELLKVRKTKIRPGLDDKSITSWNALMIKAYCDAYKAFNVVEYLHAAMETANFLVENLKTKDNSLFRNFKKGKVTINGFLDDYAFSIQAFIALYQITFDEKWLHESHLLLKYCLSHFYDAASSMFYYTSDKDLALIARQMELTDNVTPASNSEMAKNLFVLSKYFDMPEYEDIAFKMGSNLKENALNHGIYYANWDILMAWFVSQPFEVSIVGKDFKSKLMELNQNYLPQVFVSGGDGESSLPILKNKLIDGKTLIYVCHNKVCQQPLDNTDAVLALIKQ